MLESSFELVLANATHIRNVPGRKTGSYLRAQFLRLKARRGPMKAIVAASMLTAAYHMLRTGRAYHDLGDAYFDTRDRARIARRLVRRLHDLGLEVEVRPAA